MTDFEKFPKIPRLHGIQMLVTEKLDGTNAQIVIPSDPGEPILVGSRNRWISPGKQTDNYGFAQWVHDNGEMLRRLGPGRHFGEWWGCSIGRNYGLTDRRWYLFDALRWTGRLPEGLPGNVGVVPILYQGEVHISVAQQMADGLAAVGSVAAPGFMNPEGVVTTISAGVFKTILDKRGPSPEEG